MSDPEIEEIEGGQPSRNSGQTGPEPMEHVIEINEFSSPRVEDWIESLRNAGKRTQSQTQWPRIPKATQIVTVTQDLKKFYEPRVISFGPYHHGKPHLQPMEMIKLLYAKKFLADSQQEEKIADLYTKIRRNIEAVKSSYDCSRNNHDDESLACRNNHDDESLACRNNHDDESLAWMMLLDGCFLLQFIRSYPKNDDILQKHQICLVRLDSLLLENQLPFGVLKFIFENAKFKDNSNMEDKIKEFVTDGWSKDLEEVKEEPSHLLDLMRSALLGKYKTTRDSERKQRRQPERNGEQGGQDLQSFRSIKELKTAGIHIKPSGTSSFTDVSFNSGFFYGYLKLPPIIIDDATKPMFLNIVAYEMCPDGPNDYAVTSYICFLNELIDHPDDVKEMRSKRILYNLLGSDEDVAQIFNEIANDLVDITAYKNVKYHIQRHYDKRVNTWIAQALHDHFSTPWAFMAFIAAVLLLLLTGTQTYFAANPKK